MMMALLLALVQTQPRLAQEAETRVDLQGDPLPPHAVLRIGTTRLRPNLSVSGFF
jgi:hypothetical protein